MFAGKVWVPKQKPMDPVLESVTLEPELEEALANASDAELCDIAGKRHHGRISIYVCMCVCMHMYIYIIYIKPFKHTWSQNHLLLP